MAGNWKKKPRKPAAPFEARSTALPLEAPAEIALAFETSGHKVPQAAEAQGLPVSTLYRRRKALGLEGRGGP